MTAKRWLWLSLGFCAVRIAVHVYGSNAQDDENARPQGSLVAYFGGPEPTVLEILGQDSALVVRLEAAGGCTFRIEQPVQSASAPVHGVQVREFTGDVSIVIGAPDGAPGSGGAAGRGQPVAVAGSRVYLKVNDSIVRVLP